MGKDGGGGSSSTNTIQKADPWSGLAPYLTGGTDANGNTVQGIYPAAADWFAGPNPQYYPNSTIAIPSDATTEALRLTEQRARAGSPLLDAATQQALSFTSGANVGQNPANALINNAVNQTNPALSILGRMVSGVSSGYNAPNADFRSIGMLGNLANQPGAAGESYLNQLAGQSGSPDIAGWLAGSEGAYANPALAYYNNLLNASNTRAQYLNPFAQGDYVNANPYLDAMMNAASQGVTRNFTNAVAPSIASQFQLGGRGGSNYSVMNQFDTAERALGDTLSNLSANLYGQNYQQQRALQAQAAGEMANVGAQEQAARLAATQGLVQGSAQDIQNRLASIAGLGSAYRGNQALQLQAGQALTQAQQQDLAQRIQAATGMSAAEASRYASQVTSAGNAAEAQNRANAIQLSAAQGLGALSQQQVANQLAGAGVIGSNYNFDIANQLGMIGQAPGLAATDYGDIAQLGAVGATRDQINQQALNDLINRFNFEQNNPLQKLQAYNQLLQGGMQFGTQTGQSTTQGGQGTNGLLGTGLLGASLFNSMGGTWPWAAGAGAAGAGYFGGLGAAGAGSGLGLAATGSGLGALGSGFFAGESLLPLMFAL